MRFVGKIEPKIKDEGVMSSLEDGAVLIRFYFVRDDLSH